MTDFDVRLTVVEVCQCVRLPLETIVEIVEIGIVQPEGQQPAEWEFDNRMLGLLRKAHRLQRDLELDWHGVALALDLIEQLESARAENARLRKLLL